MVFFLLQVAFGVVHWSQGSRIQKLGWRAPRQFTRDRNKRERYSLPLPEQVSILALIR